VGKTEGATEWAGRGGWVGQWAHGQIDALMD